MRKADFDLNHMINTLNTTTYKIGGTESFTINVFSPWFDANGNHTISNVGGNLSLIVPIGTVPVGYTVPVPPDSIYAVNFEFTGLNPTEGGRAGISGYSIPARPPPPDTLTLNLSDDFNANPDERVAFAVQPLTDQTINDGQTLELPLQARYFFPKYGGAISVKRNDYFYEERKEEPEGAPTKVVLTNLSKRPDSVWNLPVTAANDWVILSPRNYLVVPTGTSDGTIYGGDYLFGQGIYDASLIRPGSAPADITAEDLLTNLSEQETDTRFFGKDMVEYKLDIGGGQTDEFGSAFFDGDMSIGGEQDYCAQGACLFALGVRVFFLLDFNQQGDGITFTLLSKGFGALGPPNNSASSVGGDFQLSELLGYAGDSRLDAAGTSFLASSTDDQGLDPPKIAVEFDTRTNNAVGDPPPDYCADASTANFDTRNDPLASNKDAVQYVFWGRTSFLNIPCRDDNTLYDDNRHDADGEEATEEWRFEDPTGPISLWRPAIGPDGTIYMSAIESVGDGKIYALNEDGSVKWTFPLGAAPGGNNTYMPGVDPVSGTIYSDIAGDAIVAINPDGTEKWQLIINADVDSTPIVGDNPAAPSFGTIFFGSEDPPDAIFAVNPDGTLRWEFNTGAEVNTVPVLSPDGTVVYAVSNDDNLYAVNVSANAAIDGTLKWQFALSAESGEINSSPTVNPSTGTIYVGSDDHNVYAINPADGSEKWRFTTGADVESSPTVARDPRDNELTVYIGSDDDNVYALDAQTGAKKWEFDTGSSNVVSSPIVDLDGTIYVGSENGNVYAINPDGTQKWTFTTGAAVQSSPAIGDDGFIHIGSNNTNFFTISQFADPRNFKDEDKSAGKLLTFEDLDSTVSVDSNTDWLNGDGAKGSWAVRLEVDRSLIPNAEGKFDYDLRLWIRQCYRC
jgi:outer membrane protein assembly factor BamB